nr:hypothetical protein K4M20_00296 [Agrobacterium fabrum]
MGCLVNWSFRTRGRKSQTNRYDFTPKAVSGLQGEVLMNITIVDLKHRTGQLQK